ncbi:hypothetical protein Enr13x_23370 [Stieleria neptunia]|uniref:Uncharacterized protein n=1 Tax=Stieleria neptunia TaxID=2527979 RepID=A0A518HNT1_9BACT|nr:hypothetical protein Enr13x_23370 [Stieleria neptunia]
MSVLRWLAPVHDTTPAAAWRDQAISLAFGVHMLTQFPREKVTELAAFMNSLTVHRICTPVRNHFPGWPDSFLL